LRNYPVGLTQAPGSYTNCWDVRATSRDDGVLPVYDELVQVAIIHAAW